MSDSEDEATALREELAKLLAGMSVTDLRALLLAIDELSKPQGAPARTNRKSSGSNVSGKRRR